MGDGTAAVAFGKELEFSSEDIPYSPPPEPDANKVRMRLFYRSEKGQVNALRSNSITEPIGF